MRTVRQISDELDKLYSELDIVQSMSEESVRLTFNADCKGKYISLLNKEIDSLENELEESEISWQEAELCKDCGPAFFVLVK